MKGSITTVLFDLDGVLIDSAVLVRESFDHTFAAFNVKTRFADIAGDGATIREVYGKVSSTEDDLRKMVQAHIDFQKDNLHLVVAYSDAADTLRALREKGKNIGVITNRSANARSIIEHCGLAPLIDLVISVEDVKNPKPHPEGILKAIAHFGAEPFETIMVGDMPIDIQAGKAAGVMTIAIDTSDCLEALKESGPDRLIESLGDLVSRS